MLILFLLEVVAKRSQFVVLGLLVDLLGFIFFRSRPLCEVLWDFFAILLEDAQEPFGRLQVVDLLLVVCLWLLSPTVSIPSPASCFASSSICTTTSRP